MYCSLISKATYYLLAREFTLAVKDHRLDVEFEYEDLNMLCLVMSKLMFQGFVIL